MKRPRVLCIFAHPDDESFGPAGTIYKLAQTHDVYLVSATRGDAGENHLKDNLKTLGEIREEELRASASFLGVKKVFVLDYKDGALSNSLYHRLARDVGTIARQLRIDTFLTFDTTGLSGHIDHITMAMVSTYLFYKLPFVKKIMYYCLTEEHRSLIKRYFIYAPPGRKKEDLDTVIDVSQVWDRKLAAIKIHKSQAKDGRRIAGRFKKLDRKEYFRTLIK